MTTPADERKFIHDVANQLAIVMASIESLTDVLADVAPQIREQGKNRVDRSMKSLEKVRILLQERRAALIKESEGE